MPTSIPPYITDGITVVDISASNIEKLDDVRVVELKPPNRPGNIIQTFGDMGISLNVNGQWPTGAGVLDYRLTVQSWADNNVAVNYNDGYTFGWFTIHDYHYEYVQGIPPTTNIVYKMTLKESIRRSVDDSGGLPVNTINTTAFLTATTPATFSDQGRSWVTYDTGSPLFWTAQLTSINQSLVGRISLYVSSTGADWTRSSDIGGSNATSGMSVWCNPSTGLWECAWAEPGQALKYVNGTIASTSISLGSVVQISSAGYGVHTNTNLHPYLYVSSSGTAFVTATSAGGLFMTYDSVDKVNWTGRSAYPSPAVLGGEYTPSMAGDVFRYASFYISHIAQTTSGGVTSPSYVSSVNQVPLIGSSFTLPAATVVGGDTVLACLVELSSGGSFFSSPSVTDNEGNSYTLQNGGSAFGDNNLNVIGWLYSATTTSASSNLLIRMSIGGTSSVGGIASVYRGVGSVSAPNAGLFGTGTTSSVADSYTSPGFSRMVVFNIINTNPVTITEVNNLVSRNTVVGGSGTIHTADKVASAGETLKETLSVPNQWSMGYAELIPAAGYNPELFIKRIVFHSQSAGIYGTSCLFGYSERDYGISGVTVTSGGSKFNDEFASGQIGVFALGDWSRLSGVPVINSTPSQIAPVYDSCLTMINDPYKVSASLASVGVGAFIDSKGGLYYLQLSDVWDSSLSTQSNPVLAIRSDTTVVSNSPTYGHLIRMCSGGGQFVTTGLTSANGNLDLFYIENDVLRRYTFSPPTGTNPTELDTTNTPLGIIFNNPVYCNRPRYTLTSAGQKFVIWTEGA